MNLRKTCSVLFICSAVIFVSLCFGCGKKTDRIVSAEKKNTVTVQDADGNSVAVPYQPKRTVICYGSLVPIWCDAGGQVVGIPSLLSAENIPEHIRGTETVGSFSHLNLEKILLLNPDLVILMNRAESQRQAGIWLKSHGIPVLQVEYKTYDDFLNLQNTFAEITGGTPSQNTREQVQQIIRSVPKAETPPRFYIIFASGRGISVEGSQTNTGRMAEMLGGVNLAGKLSQSRIMFDVEKIITDDPDVIFFVTMGSGEAVQKKVADELFRLPAWRNLSAVKNHRVHFLPNHLFLYLPGLRFPEAFEMLKNYLYP